MRKVNIGDAFNIVRVIKANDLQSTVKACVKQAEGTTNEDGSAGLDIFISLMAEPKTERCIYDVLNPIVETEVECLPLDEVIDLIEQLMKENDLQKVFSTVGRLLKVKSAS